METTIQNKMRQDKCDDTGYRGENHMWQQEEQQKENKNREEQEKKNLQANYWSPPQ